MSSQAGVTQLVKERLQRLRTFPSPGPYDLAPLVIHVGSLDLEVEDYVEMTKIVLGVADQHSKGWIVSVLEGGYHLEALASSVETHVTRLLGGAKP